MPLQKGRRSSIEHVVMWLVIVVAAVLVVLSFTWGRDDTEQPPQSNPVIERVRARWMASSGLRLQHPSVRCDVVS